MLYLGIELMKEDVPSAGIHDAKQKVTKDDSLDDQDHDGPIKRNREVRRRKAYLGHLRNNSAFVLWYRRTGG